ncbi:YbaB/EbfC family nucleoid-associated protein [Nocardia sp. NPDC127579]|uniref:YbaB/EbfC family nucleoid-associated protein n=1 Tax=Nocardia sp. NPDC127579 TaxID=3345402 RepID=UPI00363FDA24
MDIEQSQATIQQMQEALTRIRATASTVDGAVTVEVGADGFLHAITLDEFGRELDQRQLAEAIVDTYRSAFAEATALMHREVEYLEAAARDAAPVEVPVQQSMAVPTAPVAQELPRPAEDPLWPYLRPYQASDDPGVYAPIEPGDHNPYAAVYDDRLSPRRRMHTDVAARSHGHGAVARPAGDDWFDAAWRDPRVSPLYDYYLPHDGLWDD